MSGNEAGEGHGVPNGLEVSEFLGDRTCRIEAGFDKINAVW